MTEEEFHNALTWFQIVLSPLTMFATSKIRAPYGRHKQAGWGPEIPVRLGWIFMESPAVFLFLIVFFRGEKSTEIAPLIYLTMWQFHYVHRTLIFPFRMHTGNKQMPLFVVLSAFSFQIMNVYVNAWHLSHFSTPHRYTGDSWLTDPRFVIGLALFALGFVVNIHSDTILIKLREQGGGDGVYQIPMGGMFRFVSCPNYLGEIIEWIGYAISTWSLPGFAFALYTVANLVPRAFSHHEWYEQKFENYTSFRRKAVIPFLA